MANKRARSHVYPGPKKGGSAKNDNTRTLGGARQSVRVLSGQASQAVGRPGFGGYVPGPSDGKIGVRRLMARDPSVGREQAAADKISGTNVDLVGAQNPTILSAAGTQKAFGTGRKTISTGQPTGSRKSSPVKR